MIIYALGFIAIYLLFFLMYANAIKKLSILGLTGIEKFEYTSTKYRMLIMMATGIRACYYHIVQNPGKT